MVPEKHPFLVLSVVRLRPPKSEAGKRIVVVPDAVMPALRQHMIAFPAPGDEGLVFTTPTGRPWPHSRFRSRIWLPALRAAGLPLIHFMTCAILGTRTRAPGFGN
jgi:hypothetical protein